MKTFTCEVKIIFTGNEFEAEDVEEYKELVIESFNDEFPSIDITEDEIHNIQEEDIEDEETDPDDDAKHNQCLNDIERGKRL